MKPANYAPVYAAALYPEWASIAREHGYALAVHGSLARDFDLVAIPWTDAPQPPEALLQVLTTKFACKLVGGPPTLKPHGRLAYSLSIGFGECFADLSFMPRTSGVTAAPLPAGDDPEKRPDFYTWTWDVEIGGGRWEARYGWKKPEGKVHNLKPLFTHGVDLPDGGRDAGK